MYKLSNQITYDLQHVVYDNTDSLCCVLVTKLLQQTIFDIKCLVIVTDILNKYSQFSQVILYQKLFKEYEQHKNNCHRQFILNQGYLRNHRFLFGGRVQ